MGLLSGLFGGGGTKTTVTQTTKNETNFTSEVAIDLDLGDLGQVFEQVNERINATIQTTSERSAEILESIKNLLAVSEAGALQVESEKNDLLKQAIGLAKLAGLGIVTYLIIRNVL